MVWTASARYILIFYFSLLYMHFIITYIHMIIILYSIAIYLKLPFHQTYI